MRVRSTVAPSARPRLSRLLSWDYAPKRHTAGLRTWNGLGLTVPAILFSRGRSPPMAPPSRHPSRVRRPPGPDAVALRLGGICRTRVRTSAHPPSPNQQAEFRDDEILVAEMTSPDWVPAMRRAAALITDGGGVTCHAAIVSGELQVPT